MKRSILLFVLIFNLLKAYSQVDTNLWNMSLEELINLEVRIASKQSENLSETPLSTSVITYKEIVNSGINNIQELFRLAVGFIVREQTNGVYDLHILGFDYLQNKTSISYSQNMMILVMIDNRVVFRDFQGGTYWETLPISIEDIERVEIVRGPSSSLYGPNAVMGVINFITRKTSKRGLNVNASANYGNFNTMIANGNIGYNFKNKLSLNISASHQARDRYQNTYFDYLSNKYIEDPDSIKNVQNKPAFKGTGKTRYPDITNALKNTNLNFYLHYKPADRINFDLSGGINKSDVQKIYVDVIYTPFTTEYSDSRYINLTGNVYGLNIQASYLNGSQNTRGVLGWQYQFVNIDGNIEYNIKVGNNKTITPGITYRNVIIDDTSSREINGMGLINQKAILTTSAATLRSDFKFFDKLRTIAAIRIDKYNYPQKIYFSYNFAITYKTGSSNLIRAVVSRANKGSNILDLYIDYNYKNFLIYRGNKNILLTTVDNYELGYRHMPFNNLFIDIEASYDKIKNLSLTTVYDSVKPNPLSPYGITRYFNAQNLPLKADMFRISMSSTYQINSNINFKLFVTYQNTQIKDIDKFPTNSMIDTLYKTTNKWTPSFYGGYVFNFTFLKNFTFNNTAYFMTKQKFIYLETYEDVISSQIILNFNLIYTIKQKISININAKNITFPQNSKQFAFADYIKPLFLAGVRINL